MGIWNWRGPASRRATPKADSEAAAAGTVLTADGAGGVAWQALLTATCEAVIAVALSIWLLGHFQRRHDHVGRLGKAMGRAAFGAYVLQAPVLVIIAVSASALAVAPEVKFFAVASAAVAGSFGLAWLLTRLPLVNRVL